MLGDKHAIEMEKLMALLNPFMYNVIMLKNRQTYFNNRAV